MKILYVNCNKSKNIISSLNTSIINDYLKEINYTQDNIEYEYVHKSELDKYHYDNFYVMNHDNSKMFDYIDIVILHSDYETMPWYACNAKLLQFFKQVIHANKHCYASEHLALFVPFILSTGGNYCEVINSKGLGGNLRDIKYIQPHGLLPWQFFFDQDSGDLYVWDEFKNHWAPTVNVGFRKIRVNEKNLKSHRSVNQFAEKSFISLVNRKFANHWVVRNLNFSYLTDTYMNKFVMHDFEQQFDNDANYRLVYLIENNKGPCVFMYKNILCNILKFDNRDLSKSILKNFLKYTLDDIFHATKTSIFDAKVNLSIYNRVHFEYNPEYNGWFEKIPELIFPHSNSTSKSCVKVNTDQLYQNSRFMQDLDENEMPLFYTTNLNTHISNLGSIPILSRNNLDQSTLSFAKTNNKLEMNNISSMQDMKSSLKKESTLNLISPFQLNTSNKNFSFHYLNETQNSNTRPQTGKSNKSRQSEMTRPLTGKSKRSNVNSSHDYSLLNYKGKQVLESTKDRGGTVGAAEILEALDYTSYKFSKSRPQNTRSLKKLVAKYGDKMNPDCNSSKFMDYYNQHSPKKSKSKSKSMIMDETNASFSDVKEILKLDEESSQDLEKYNQLKQMASKQTRAPRKFYNNLKNVALSQTYAKCNPWLGGGPSIGCRSEYMSRHDQERQHERETKQIALSLHKGKPFRGFCGMDSKERKNHEMSANVHNQPSEFPLANFNFRPDHRKSWIAPRDFII